MSRIPSIILEQAVDELSRMPGIGRRTALRLALWILKQDRQSVAILGNSIIRLSEEICYCSMCHNISDEPLCRTCSDYRRDHTQICVVQDVRDVMAIEQTGQYRGLYHVLGGVISPVEGVSPSDLNIDSLIKRITGQDIREVIMAINTSIEGETTAFYIYRKIKDQNITVSAIARGVPIGDELEYADEVTLGRSIVNRVPYETGCK